MEINKETKIKAIQFTGSPFQGKAWEAIKKRLKEKLSSAGSLSQSEVQEISSRYVHSVDKFPRMFGGIASNLERYENGIIYLRIENAEKQSPSNYELALKYARSWRDGNKELKNAKGFVVSVYKTKSTGFAMHGPDIVKNKGLLNNLVEQFKSSTQEEKKLVNIFSGLFTDQIEPQASSRPEIIAEQQVLNESANLSVKKGFIPEQCVLWKKQNIEESDVSMSNFDLVETYIDTNHFWRSLLKCKECSQLYLFEFKEDVNWSKEGNGNDYQYSTWIPVAPDDAAALKDKSPLELLDPDLVPRIQGDLTPFRETPVHWVR